MSELKVTNNVLRLTGAFVFTYFVVYIASIIIVLLYYSDFPKVIFEVTSCLSNVVLSSGLITASSPTVVKIVFIIDLWMGRLEIWPVLLLSFITIKNISRR